MNYRHAFHAGNFADCFKHALLVLLLRGLTRKPAPLFVLDTHAGAGHYDLTAGPATRTNEAAAGIFRLVENTPEPLRDYVGLVRDLGLYPGSPALIRALLRPEDRLVCCELHPEDHATLRARFRDDGQVGVHRRDGWESLKAFLPPKQTRALILIDPPYEDPLEFQQLARHLEQAHARFRQGVFAAWYPIKHLAPVRGFKEALALPDMICVEFLSREPLDPARLNGCGLLIINPPYRFQEAARPILDALLARLGTGEPGAVVEITRLTDE